MPYHLHIIELMPCGCDAEGQVRARLEDGVEIWFYYQSSDQQAAQLFQEGTTIEMGLVGRLSSASATTKSIKALSFPRSNCCYQATGLVTSVENLDGEVLFTLASTFSLKVDNELGKEPVVVGSWVHVQGELWAET